MVKLKQKKPHSESIGKGEQKWKKSFSKRKDKK